MQNSAVTNSTYAVSDTPADRNAYASSFAAHSNPAQNNRWIRGTVAAQPF